MVYVCQIQADIAIRVVFHKHVRVTANRLVVKFINQVPLQLTVPQQQSLFEFE